MSDEKQKLITEIVNLFKMDTQMAQLTDSILKEMETTYPIGYNTAVDSRPDLTPSEKAKLKASSKASFVSFSEKFRSRLAGTVDYKKYIEDAIYPLYDKFYTEQELRDLIAFYRTPTGQKVIETLPQLFSESQIAAREKLVPQVLPILQQMLKEEFDKVATVPAAKKPN